MENFISIPNLPDNQVSLAIVDGRISNEIEYKLKELEIKIIKTIPLEDTYVAISGHPDIMLHHTGGRGIVVAPNIGDRIIYELEDNGFEITVGRKTVADKYPQNIAYNAARVGDAIICSKKYTDEAILEKADELELNIIDIKQGYSKCSICIVDKNAVITADAGIYKALERIKENHLQRNMIRINAENIDSRSCSSNDFNSYSADDIDCCFIEQGNIGLVDMKYGFIGGASGKLSINTLGFYGNICLHPSFEKINAFLMKYGKKSLNLCENTVLDFGTFIPLKEYSIMTK